MMKKPTDINAKFVQSFKSVSKTAGKALKGLLLALLNTVGKLLLIVSMLTFMTSEALATMGQKVNGKPKDEYEDIFLS